MTELFNEYIHVITDPAHVLAEATFILIESVIIGAILVPLGRRFIRRHDEKEHGHRHGHGKF